MDREEEAAVTAGRPGGYGEAVLRGLQPFQRRTAEHAFDRLYGAADTTRRFLVADEVGLGKTLVAAGVIARAIDHLSDEGIRRIDVIYICSNQAIARQNVDRIKHRLSLETRPLAQRISLLPYRIGSLEEQPINLIALTPGTSFSAASAEGVVEERVILFRMLTRAWGPLGRGARAVFKGSLSTVARLMEYESVYPNRPIDASITERFECEVGGPGSELHAEFERVRDRLSRSPDEEARRLRSSLVSRLRRKLAHACLDALEPDLVVLDEFQRFRDLLDPATKGGELAQRLFEYEDAHTKVRTLLLSATPYKMYTLSHEPDEDHYRDFIETVQFLQGPGGSVEPLECALSGFRAELPRAASAGAAGAEARERLSGHRASIEDGLRRVMSRTERRGRAGGGDPMLEVAGMGADLSAADVEAYLGAREIAAEVGAPGVVEYWKSAPYLLSFMDRYRLAERVRDSVDAEPGGAVAGLVAGADGLQLRRGLVEGRRRVPGGNGRMRALLSDLADSRLHRLLWLPPSMPAHPLGRDFERARGATKRLVFSAWAMVPRAVAVMASYDAERRHIRNRARAARYESSLLPVRRDAYSLFAMMAPSETLAEAGDPLRYAARSPAELLRAIGEALRPRVEALTRGAPASGSPQEIWYAAAPVMLDLGSGGAAAGWLRGPAAAGAGVEGETGVWDGLADRVMAGVADPPTLGRPPANLLETMAALAAASPANAALRALSRATSTRCADAALKSEAMRAAWALRHLLRVPASEGLLRNLYRPSVPGVRAYWRRALAYALEGGLSAVLEEYFCVLREDRGAGAGAADLVGALCGAIEMAGGTLEVAQWVRGPGGVRRERFAMRQHFARRYSGDGPAGADMQASQHLDAVRAAFNSPFWPFVLGTTSVGQEGLDFHWYCHSVVHWNLPPNPVDLEQREGRVHRYHGHAIRKNIAQAVGRRALDEARRPAACGVPASAWDAAYRLAEEEFAADGGLVPHWVFTGGDARILRRSPVLPLSRDAERADALRRSLAVYRMVFGQPRQDDLLEFILREVPEGRREDLAAALTIDLGPPP